MAKNTGVIIFFGMIVLGVLGFLAYTTLRNKGSLGIGSGRPSDDPFMNIGGYLPGGDSRHPTGYGYLYDDEGFDRLFDKDERDDDDDRDYKINLYRSEEYVERLLRSLGLSKKDVRDFFKWAEKKKRSQKDIREWIKDKLD